MKCTKVLNLAAVRSVDLYCRVNVYLTFHKLKGMANISRDVQDDF